MRWTIERLKNARELEDKVEFKRAEGGNFAYDGGSRTKPAERRRCILGYVIGTGSGTRYSISEDFKKGSEFLGEIFDLGLAESNRRHVTGNVQKTAPNGS